MQGVGREEKEGKSKHGDWQGPGFTDQSGVRHRAWGVVSRERPPLAAAMMRAKDGRRP